MTCCGGYQYEHCGCEKQRGASITPEMKKIEKRLARKYTCRRKYPRISKRKGIVELGPCECRCRSFGKPVIRKQCQCY